MRNRFPRAAGAPETQSKDGSPAVAPAIVCPPPDAGSLLGPTSGTSSGTVHPGQGWPQSEGWVRGTWGEGQGSSGTTTSTRRDSRDAEQGGQWAARDRTRTPPEHLASGSWAPYPFSRVPHLASGTRGSWRSWETLELQSGQLGCGRSRPRALRPAARPEGAATPVPTRGSQGAPHKAHPQITGNDTRHSQRGLPGRAAPR